MTMPSINRCCVSRARRRALIVLSLLFILIGQSGCQSTANLQRFEATHRQMGTQFRIVFYCDSPELAAHVSAEVVERIDALNAIMSDYDRNSELNALSASSGRGKAVPVSRDLWNVLVRAQKMSVASEGAFDVTVGPLVQLWRRARRIREMPREDRLLAARAAVGYEKMTFDELAKKVTLTTPDMQLDLGGIAKGYAVDEAVALLREHGITRLLVDGGGDLAVGDAPPGKPGWRIGLVPLEARDGAPSRFIIANNTAIATSGDAWQYIELDGQRYSHIVDPKTGLGLTDHSMVTIIAPDCTTADAVASAVSVLGPTKGLALVEKTAGVAALILRQPGEKVEVYESERAKHLNLEREN